MDKVHNARGEDIINEYEAEIGFRMPGYIAKDFIEYIEKKYPKRRRS